MIILERKSCYVFLALGCLATLAVLLAAPNLGDIHLTHVQIPLHAAMEAVGAITIMLVAIFLLYEESSSFTVGFFVLALGLLGMGVFDLIHSASLVGNGFVWLRCGAFLVGGLGYALTWLPSTFIAGRNRWTLTAIAALLVLIGVAVVVSDSLPPSLVHNHFSALAVQVNLVTAALFILGSLRLLFAFHNSQQIEYYLLAWFGLLNAASGFEFPFSQPWGNSWWIWHGLRFLGLGIACFLLVYRQLETRKRLGAVLSDLQRANTTIRDQAEAELRSRELEFTRVTNTLPGPVSRVDSEGRYLFANEAYERWFGKRPADVIGRTKAEILGDELYQQVRPNILRVLTGETVIYPMTVKTPAGERLHGQVSLIPDLDRHEKVRGYFTIVLDITERKQAEDALLASQASLRKINRTYAVLSAVNQTIVRERNPQALFAEACRIAVEIGGFRMAWIGRLDKQSKAICPVAQTGFSEGYVEHLTIVLDDTPRGHGPTASALRTEVHVVVNDILHDAAMAPWREAALERGYRASAAFPIKAGGETTTTLNLYSNEPGFFDGEELALLDEMAGDLGFALEFIDQEGKREAAEVALRQAALDWQTTFAAISDAICLINTDHTIVNANQAMIQLCHKGLEEIIGKQCWEVLHNTDQPIPECPLPKMTDTKTRASIEVTVGDHIFEVIVDPILGQGDSIVGIVHIMRDITEHKALGEQLQQAQRLETVGRLAGGVAHDFNNMLGVILGYTEIAMDKVDIADPLYDDLEEIYKAGQRSVDITRQLLTFARKQIVTPQVLDLNELVEAMLKMLRRLIGEDILLEWRPMANLWRVKIDPTQVDQVLANLSVNARDAIKGTGTLTIETSNVVIDEVYCKSSPEGRLGEYCLLAVSDTGTGMDKATIAKIFEPFFTTKGAGKGTGLGLATVYGVVKQNNGFINVYSEPGQGTTFKIYLPRVQEVVALKTVVVDPKTTRGNETVLLVEDEEAILQLGKMLLTKHGYTVLAANTPTKAIGLVAKHQGPIELLITDIVMPEMNGKELMEKISEIRPGIKTLFMSGYTADVIAHHGVLEKDVQFLQKPFTLKEITCKVRAALEQG